MFSRTIMLSKSEKSRLQVFLKSLSGKWIAFGGNRWINERTFKRTQAITRELIKQKCKIVTGGAEGVDNAIAQASLKYKIPESDLRIYLPQTIERQYQRYKKLEGERKAKKLLVVLKEIQKLYPKSIIENKHEFKNYRLAANHRNSLIEAQARGMIMVKPQGSRGSSNALRKAIRDKVPFIVFKN